MPAFQFACPHCGGKFSLENPPAGQAVACPQCGNLLEVPAELSASAAEAPPLVEPPAEAEPYIPFDFHDVRGKKREPAIRIGQRRTVATDVRRLSRSERARRQQIRSLIVMAVGIVVLILATVFLSRR